MTNIEELAQVEFDKAPIKVPPISPAKWQKRCQDEFANYQLLAPILNLDNTGLVRRIEKSGDHEMWMQLVESFDELSGRADAFCKLLESGSARLMIALAHIATTEEADKST